MTPARDQLLDTLRARVLPGETVLCEGGTADGFASHPLAVQHCRAGMVAVATWKHYLFCVLCGFILASLASSLALLILDSDVRRSWAPMAAMFVSNVLILPLIQRSFQRHPFARDAARLLRSGFYTGAFLLTDRRLLFVRSKNWRRVIGAPAGNVKLQQRLPNVAGYTGVVLLFREPEWFFGMFGKLVMVGLPERDVDSLTRALGPRPAPPYAVPAGGVAGMV